MSFGNLHSLVIPTIKRIMPKSILRGDQDIFEVKTKDGVFEVDFIYYTDDESLINNEHYNNHIIRLFDGRDFCRGNLVKSFKVVKGSGLINSQPLAAPTGIAFGIRMMNGSNNSHKEFNSKNPIEYEDKKEKINPRILY